MTKRLLNQQTMPWDYLPKEMCKNNLRRVREIQNFPQKLALAMESNYKIKRIITDCGNFGKVSKHAQILILDYILLKHY